MIKQDKVKIDKEVFEIITGKLALWNIPFTKQDFKFALEMFLEEVKFIPNKGKERLGGE